MSTPSSHTLTHRSTSAMQISPLFSLTNLSIGWAGGISRVGAGVTEWNYGLKVALQVW